MALALVVTYRSSGVVNFATGAIALFGAYQYAFLRKGELLVLIPVLPETIDLGADLYFWPAVLVSLAISALLGLLLYLVRVPTASRGARRWRRPSPRSASWSS